MQEKWLDPALSSLDDPEIGTWCLFWDQGHPDPCPPHPEGGSHPAASSLTADPKEKPGKDNNLHNSDAPAPICRQDLKGKMREEK